MSYISGRLYCPPRTVVYNPAVPFTFDSWSDPFYHSHLSNLAAVPHHPFPTTLANTNIEHNEIPDAHVYTARLPAGFTERDVKVEIESGVLSIIGEKKIEKEEKTDTWHRVERGSGKFLKRFRLPENAKADHINQTTTGVENGVLTVRVPKKEMMKRNHRNRSIDIEIDDY